MTRRLLMTADTVGGVWQYATDLAEALGAHGWEVVIAVLGPAPSPDQRAALDLPLPFRGEGAERSEGGRGACRSPSDMPLSPEGERDNVTLIQTNLPLDWLATSPEPVLAAGEAIATLARDLRANLVHLNTPALAARARFPVPMIAADHGAVATWWSATNATPLPPEYAWQRDLTRDGLHAADAVIAPTAAYAAAVAREYALPTAPVAVHNGRRALSLPADQPRVDAAFTAGRLWDQTKNTALLDRVAARLSIPFRAAGPLRGPHGQEEHPSHLACLGRLDEAELAKELAARPIFVSAARFEPFGLAVLEAATAGCALVLSDIATFRELWDDAALFVPADDDRACADAIARILAEPDLRATLEQAARARAARYTPVAMAAGMAAIYNRLLGAERKAAA